MNPRIRKLLRNGESLGIDAVVISSLTSIRYLTGFTGSNGACLLNAQHNYFITDFRYQEQVKQQIEGFSIIIDPDPPLQQIIDRKIISRTKKIGFEDKTISYQDYARLLSYFPKNNLVPLGDSIINLSSVKDKEELEYLTKAVAITDDVFHYLLTIVKPGIREIEISAEISCQIKKRGGERDAFEPIVASGQRAALPHGISSLKQLQAGELVILDFGAVYRGYHGDLTRTVILGEPTRRQKEIYKTVLEAQETAISQARSGISGARLDSVARKVIQQRGFGEFFGHGLGHGLGLEIHEAPRLAKTNKVSLKVGNVVTIEPGIYIPEFGGVRIEDDVVIEKNGCKNLTHAPKELIVL